LGALACGSGSETGGPDAGSDVATDSTKPCAVDFPCAQPWACIDSTHWVETKSIPQPPCSGLICVSTGVTHACDQGLECATDPTAYASAPCAPSGHDGCWPDAGTFTPQLAAPPPVKQQGVCDDTTIQQVATLCVDPTTSDGAKCAALTQVHEACVQCLSATFTPVVTTTEGQDVVPNIAGCYAVLDGTSAPGSCAALADTNVQCAVAACEACEQWSDAFPTCFASARTTACAAFPTCGVDAGTSATCEASPKDFFIGFGEALCGP
jgi:hypothetical protein